MFKSIWIKILRLVYRIQQKGQFAALILAKRSVRQNPPLICFSHPRCATQSMGKILETVCCHKRFNLYWGYAKLNRSVLDDMMSKYHLIFLHRTEPGDYPDQFRDIPFKGFHMIRDPRNVLVSMYYSHKITHKLDRYTGHIARDRVFLQQHGEEEGLLYLIDHSRQFNEMAESLLQWDLADRRLMTIRFEDYVNDVKGHWMAILGYLGWPFPEKKLDRILSHYSFEQMQSSSKSVSGITHYRSSQKDDYERHFTPAVREKFNKKFGDLVVRLGYAQNLPI